MSDPVNDFPDDVNKPVGIEEEKKEVCVDSATKNQGFIVYDEESEFTPEDFEYLFNRSNQPQFRPIFKPLSSVLTIDGREVDSGVPLQINFDARSDEGGVESEVAIEHDPVAGEFTCNLVEGEPDFDMIRHSINESMARASGSVVFLDSEVDITHVATFKDGSGHVEVFTDALADEMTKDPFGFLRSQLQQDEVDWGVVAATLLFLPASEHIQGHRYAFDHALSRGQHEQFYTACSNMRHLCQDEHGWRLCIKSGVVYLGDVAVGNFKELSKGGGKTHVTFKDGVTINFPWAWFDKGEEMSLNFELV